MVEADEALCDAIIAQLEDNGYATSGGAATSDYYWESAPDWVDRATGFSPFTWDAYRWAVLRAELDAHYARL